MSKVPWWLPAVLVASGAEGSSEGGVTMPLSEHEQRLLEQMEKALYAEDPKFATSLRSAPGARAARGRAALGVLGLLAGIGLLVAGAAEDLTGGCHRDPETQRSEAICSLIAAGWPRLDGLCRRRLSAAGCSAA